MPREGIPINSAIIAWARKRAGLSEQEAAKKFTKIGAWEAGSALPTYPQLEKLADEFKLPVAVFFLPDVPNVPPIRESFRTLPDTEFDQIPRQVSALLRKAKALQLNLSELTGGRNPAPRRRMAKLNYSASPPAPRPCHILGDAPIPSGGAPPARCERSWIIRSRLPREHSCRCARSRHLSGRRLVSFDHGCCTTSRAHVFRFETSTNPNGGVIIRVQAFDVKPRSLRKPCTNVYVVAMVLKNKRTSHVYLLMQALLDQVEANDRFSKTSPSNTFSLASL